MRNDLILGSFRLLFFVSLLFGAVGCEGDKGAPVQEVQVGQFIDGPVSGLYFETATQSGVTGSNGEFNYVKGELITFYLGGLAFPPISATTVITPISYVPSAANASNPHVVNIIRVLQSLDMDLDHGNGIQLPPSLSENIVTSSAESLVFNVEVDEFEKSPQVTTLLQINNITLLTNAEVAIANFQQILDDFIAELLDNAANEPA